MTNEMWNKFIKKEIGIACRTIEEAKELLKYCHEKDVIWLSMQSLLTDTNFYPPCTVYFCLDKRMTRSNLEYAQNKTTVIEYKDIKGEKQMLKSELKTGMWIEKRNGTKAIILLGTTNGDIYSGETWGMLSCTREDLTSTNGKEFDIVKVYQPKHNADMTDNTKINSTYCKVLYTRKDNSNEIAAIKKTIEDAEKSLKEAKQKLVELEG